MGNTNTAGAIGGMGNADATAALGVNHRAAPSEQGLSTSTSPLTANTAEIPNLGNVIDQAMTGSTTAASQLNALLSDPNAVAALTQSDNRTVRGGRDLLARTPREAIVEAEMPSIEQIRSLEQLTRQEAQQIPTMEQLLEQVRTATAPAAQTTTVPAATTSPVVGTQQAVAPAGPVAAPPVGAPAPDANQTQVLQLMQMIAEQNKALMQALAPQPEPEPQHFDVRRLSAADQIRWAAETLLSEGAPKEAISRDLAISRLKHEENRMIAAEFAAYRAQNDQRWEELSSHAAQYRTQNELSAAIGQHLGALDQQGRARFDQARVTPALRGVIETVARSHIAAGSPPTQAVASAVAALEHLLAAQHPAAQQTQQAVQTKTPPTPAPNLAPAYAGKTPLEIQQQQRTMSAAAMAGNGAGRFGSAMPDLNTLDGLVLALRN